MTETNKQSMKWKKHEIEEQIGYDQCKFQFSYLFLTFSKVSV
jgi:hypothetical protein